MTEPISLADARKRKRSGGGNIDKPVKDCPVIALGHEGGMFHFLDVLGQIRKLNARQLGSRSDVASLFVGDTGWLLENFPKRIIRREVVDGETVEQFETAGFNAPMAGEYLMRAAGKAGFFGGHVVLRRPGIWVDADKRPVVHCGDAVLFADGAQAAGQSIAGCVWLADFPIKRPGDPCAPSIGRDLQRGIQELWEFRNPGSAIAVCGWIGTSYFGAAAPWRPSLYLIGAAGGGKSKLLSLMRACLPLHHYTNDTTKAGIEGAVNGRAMPILVDEAADKTDQRGAEALLDMVVSSSSGEGTRGHRGTADGGMRRIEVVGCIAMASINPPPMRPQHLGRFSVLDLVKPRAGADHSQSMADLTAEMAACADALWGRALASWDRWREALARFRAALANAGCAPREMDQAGALLAGWWIMTEDGLPDTRQALDGVAALGDLARRADEVADDDSPREVITVLLSQLVQYDGSTRQEQIGNLLRRAFDGSAFEADAELCAKVLGRYGIRPIRADQPADHKGRPAPRRSEGDGVWLLPVSVKGFFRHTPWDGDRWLFELMRLPKSHRAGTAIRVGDVVGKPIWVSRSAWEIEDG